MTIRSHRASHVWSVILPRIWRGIREWCGDAAYDRYLQSQAKRLRGQPTMTREEFYLSQLQKKYSRVSRCC
jgi:uncharacterized short protein YbdD (DUF466 family)